MTVILHHDSTGEFRLNTSSSRMYGGTDMKMARLAEFGFPDSNHQPQRHMPHSRSWKGLIIPPVAEQSWVISTIDTLPQNVNRQSMR
jgi:hypothetical protein